ncbi:TatD family hydrolase [Parabacteroides sp. FAFU027]|uniref:TatD family hydrolase n=1 Tax=Parabacteroides sp. FAFU027 TaxID=2922715 RepID=UPI001FAFBA83|nr:TatD family hydrolase [Parabacteroides sp. FAFU027]
MHTFFNLHTHQNGEHPAEVAVLDCPSGKDLPSSFYSVSLHPWMLSPEKLDQAVDFIFQNHSDKNFIAIGECGLDKLCETSFDLQTRTFRQMIELSEQYEKPLIIHCVKAFDELISLKKEYLPKQPWVIHGFRGNPIQAKQLIQQGFCLSFGPKHNIETIKNVPLWAVFTETDDSDCSIDEVYRLVASELNISVEELAGNIRNNAIKYLKLAI